MTSPNIKRLDAIIEALELPVNTGQGTFNERIGQFLATEFLTPEIRATVALMACTGSYPTEAEVARLTPPLAVGSHEQALKILAQMTRKASRKSRAREPEIFSGTIIDVSRSSRALSITGIPRVAMSLSAEADELGALSVVWEGGGPGIVTLNSHQDGWSMEPRVWAQSLHVRKWLLSLKGAFWKSMNRLASLPQGHSFVRAIRTLVSPLANVLFDRSGPQTLLILADCHYVTPEVPRLGIVTRVLAWEKVNPRLRTTVVLHDLLPIIDSKHFAPDQSLEHIEFMRFIAACSTVIIPSPHLNEQVDAVRALFDSPPQARTIFAPYGLSTHAESALSSRSVTPGTVKQPTFIMIGSMDDRKNHALAFWALGLMGRGINGNIGIASTLHVVGARRPTSDNTRDALAFAQANNVTVIEHHNASDALVQEIRSNCHATLYLSWSEGFGLPILESLAQGVPVIASDIPPHRAHLPYGGITLTPAGDPRALCDILTAMATTDPNLIQRGDSINYRALPANSRMWAQLVLEGETPNIAMVQDPTRVGHHTTGELRLPSAAQ